MKFFFISSNSNEALSAKKKLIGVHGQNSVEKADVIIPLGGDGFLLKSLHDFNKFNKPFYGINYGSIGFLMNKESDVNLMIYHTWWDGFIMDFDLLDHLVNIPNVNSIKWSHSDIGLFKQGLSRYSEKVSMISNGGDHILSNIYGASGFITHLSSFWPEYPNSIWNALVEKNYQKAKEILGGFKHEWTGWVGEVVKETGGEGPFIKVAMELIGLKAGPPRPPSKTPSKELINELDSILKKYGVPRNN